MKKEEEENDGLHNSDPVRKEGLPFLREEIFGTKF